MQCFSNFSKYPVVFTRFLLSCLFIFTFWFVKNTFSYHFLDYSTDSSVMTNTRRDVAIPGRSMVSSHPTHPASLLLFHRVFCCIIWVVWDDFCFCLHSCDPKFSRFDHFPCILECLFFFLVCVRLWWGGSEGRMYITRM